MTPDSSLLRTVAALCALGLGLTSAIAADSPGLKSGHGTIKTIDQEHHSLVLTDHKNHSEHTFQWNEHTTFSESGKAVSAADLKVGEHLRISYDAGKTLALLKNVEWTPAKAAGSPAAPSHSLANKSPKK